MKQEYTQRTARLIGQDNVDVLAEKKVLLFGLGGVGSFVAEALCRAGIGHLTLVDADVFDASNLNRQLGATVPSIGRHKTEVMKERLLAINPELHVETHCIFYLPDSQQGFISRSGADYVVDAIDTISPKCFLIYEAMKRRIKIVSSMGAGAKSDITQVRFADLWETYHCGLSKAVRKRLQKMGMKRKLPVVFSTEQADPKAVLLTEDEQNKKSTCGTVSYMPAVFGCYLAEYVIKRL